MNIGEVGRHSGLPVKTIRYYEEIGLLRPDRQTNGYRIYSEHDVHMLRFVQRARGLGFSMTDCRALLSLYQDRGRASSDVKAIAVEHLEEIDRKLDELRSLRDALATMVETCRGDHRPDCPILNDLAGSSEIENK